MDEQALPPPVAGQTGTATRASLSRGGSLVAPALTVVNVAGYALTVAAARAFDADGYGRFSALLGVLLVVSVPSLAVQTVVARTVTGRPRDVDLHTALLRRSAGIGAAAAVLAAAAAPVVAAFLHTGLSGPLWLAAQVAPLTLFTACCGVALGQERFRLLAALLLLQAAGKAVALVPLALGGGVSAVLAGLAVGTALGALVAVLLVGLRPHPRRSASPLTLRDLALAAGGLGAVLLLSNLDVLLARHVLPGEASGRYGVGAVLTKVALWLPQAVAVVVFPRLTEAEQGRRLLGRAVLLVAGLGAVELGGSLLLARPALRLTFGAQYADLAPLAWLWVLEGVGLSLVQLLVYRSIATSDSRTTPVVAAAAVLETGLVLLLDPDHPGTIVALAATVVTGLVLVLLAQAGLLRRQRAG